MGTLLKTVAIGTLIFDAYLALSMLAIARMDGKYVHWLPPLGWDFAHAIPRTTILFVILWTAILAVGCLGARRKMN